ncbi:CDase [Bugula neritina]|uniref:Neutral ceramidase n=1 Tax=Bugula neritina TaxID=10212 RepID=A0A7J7IW42_BUGNE|nr:CDase [Bugula neritina]
MIKHDDICMHTNYSRSNTIVSYEAFDIHFRFEMIKPRVWSLLVCCSIVLALRADAVDTNYVVGTGIYDVTGPAAEINMMGYAKGSQKTNGIHLRQYSRAYVIADKQEDKRVVFVSVDACMISTLVKAQVIKKISALYPGLYNETNVCISGIHTHSGPGGFHQYILLDVTSLGFVQQSLDALAEGIALSIDKAHKSMKPGNLHVTSGELVGANINRSPTSYANNPAKERAMYKYNIDTTMTIVKITDEHNGDVGMIRCKVHTQALENYQQASYMPRSQDLSLTEREWSINCYCKC